MAGCQNYGPFWGTLNIRCRIIIGIQKRHHNFDNHPCRVHGLWEMGEKDSSIDMENPSHNQWRMSLNPAEAKFYSRERPKLQPGNILYSIQ